MGDTWIDALQSFENETGGSTIITNISNDDLLTPPETSDANNLIKLVNNASTNTNNLYILQANQNGEIRFLIKNAYLNNDVGTAQPYNVKIGADGKLYVYWTYNFLTNPLRFSGWYDIAEDVASQGNQLSLLELGTIALETQITVANTNIGILDSTLSGFITTQNAINTTVNTTLNEHTAEIGALGTQTAVIPTLQQYFTGSAFVRGDRKGIAGLWRRANWKEASATLAQRYTTRVNVGRSGSVMIAERTLTAPTLNAFQLVSNTTGVAMNRAVGDISTAFGIVGAGALLAGIYRYYTNAQEEQRNDLIKDLIETKEDMILQQANTPNPFYTTKNRITKTSLVIDSSTDNAYGGAVGVYEVEGLTQYAGVILNMEIYLDTGVKKARIESLVSGGDRVWVVGDQIQIPKSTKLGGYVAGAGTIDLLKINVVSIYNPLEVVDETISQLLTEQADEDRRDRRRKGVIGAGEYDSTTLTTTTETETNSVTGEIITYNTLKSRINLLPTGTSDVDVYTSTGKIGVGTTPETQIHTYDATNNIMRLGTAVNGEVSIQFKRGIDTDAYTDWRLRSASGRFELQYENDLLGYGNTGTDIFYATTSLFSILKNTQIDGNVGIGTSAETPLHTYHATNNILRIASGATTGKSGIEFVRGTATDTSTDYRYISESGLFRLQYQDNTLAFGATGSDLIMARTTGITMYKNTIFSGSSIAVNASINSAYKVNVNGDVNISTGSFYRINGVQLSYNNLIDKLTAGNNITINALTNEISAQVPNANNILSEITSGTLAVAYGGTGANDIGSGAIPFGNATESAYSWATNLKYDAPNGRLAVGLINPAYTIDCGGDINIPLTSNYRIGGNPLSYNDLANKLTAGTNITISGANEISATVPAQLTAGTGITITSGAINADTQLTAGTNIDITSGVISAIVPAQLTAGTNITITSGAINAIVPAQLTAGTNITITSGAINAIVPTTFNASAITAGTLPVSRGGTGLGVVSAGVIPFGNSTSTAYDWRVLFNWDNTNFRLGVNKSSPAYTIDTGGDINIPTGSVYRINGTALALDNLSGTLPISKGGTGGASIGAGAIPIGNSLQTAYTWTNLLKYDLTNFRLSVGVATPLYALDVAGSVNISTGNVYRVGGNALAMTNIAGTASVSQGGTGLTTITAGNILYGNDASAIAHTTSLKYVSGRLGINMTGTPATNLHIGTAFYSTGTTYYTWFDYFSGGIGFTNTARTDVCAYFQGSLWLAGGRFIASSSDTRIKKEIEDINDDSALSMILAVEPKTYKYIDEVALGDKRVYGFIAQQIREVIPEAINLQKERIPNVLLLGTYNNTIITLPSQPTKVVIKVGDKLKCYDRENKEIEAFVEEVIDTLTFRIKELEESYTDNKIFIYGTEIDDFHTIDKNYIYTLNVCATQELHRKIVSQDERIKELEAKVERLLNYLT